MQLPTSKPRVFVSSTIADFMDLRSALRFWLEAMGLEVQMSEYNDFLRRPDEGTFRSCFNAIASCDYFVLLIGARRGNWYDEAEAVSVTRKEFRVAAGLAREKHTTIVAFVRSAVATAVRQAQSPSTATADASPTRSCATTDLEDADFTRSFIDEVQTTQIPDVDHAGPGGFLWLYRFHDFRDLIQALEQSLELRRPIRQQALLANVKWELEENIALVCCRAEGGSPRCVTSGLTDLRDRLKVTNEVVVGTVNLDSDDARTVLGFWLFLPNPSGFNTTALREAVFSGEFLEYSREHGRPIEGDVQAAMHRLLDSVDSYAGVMAALGDRARESIELQLAVRQGRPTAPISGYHLAMLYKLADILDDVLHLSVALERYILDPGHEFVTPALRPVTPIEDEIAPIQAESPTHRDVEQWARDAFLWRWVPAVPGPTPEQVREAVNRYPFLKQRFDDEVAAHTAEVRRRLQQDGLQATLAWLRSLPGSDQ